MTGKNLRVGVLLDSEEVLAWQYCLIQNLLKSDGVSVCLVLYNDPEVVANGRHTAGRLYKKFEQHERSRRHVDPDALESKSINDLLGEVDSIRGAMDPTSDASASSLAPFHNVKAYQLDVIVALGHTGSMEALSAVSKYGLWYYWHDYGQTLGVDGSSVGFWEVIKRRPYIRSALVVHRTGADEEVIAYESYSAVRRMSYGQGRNEHLWKIQFFVPRAFRRLLNIGAEAFLEGLYENPHSGSLKNAAHKWRLTNLRILWPVTSYVLWRLWRKLLKRIFTDRWALMFSLTGQFQNLSRFKPILPPNGRFWADPFVVERDGDSYIFFEDASTVSFNGHISVMRMASDGVHSSPTPVLKRPYHLSYPFIFKWRDNIYMIPESAENRSIELYRFRDFPYDLEFVHNLMERVEAYDATLVEYNGLWWMFANLKQHHGASALDELGIFYSDNPISCAWHPHPLNPVVSDVRYSRPAGKLFVEDSHLYRPSQNSSYRYGYGLNVNRVCELTTEAYREEVVKTIEPTWSPVVKAVHTLNRADRLVVIDAIYRSLRAR